MRSFGERFRGFRKKYAQFGFGEFCMGGLGVDLD